MRIGIVTFDYTPIIGGQGRFAVDLSKRLLNQGHEIVVIAPEAPRLASRVKNENHPGPRPKFRGVYNFTRLSQHAHPLYALLINLQYRRIIQEEKLSALIINGGPGGCYLLSSLPVPTIVVSQITYSLGFAHRLASLWKIVLYPFERMTYRNASAIAAISTGIGRELERWYGISRNKISILHLPVRPPEIAGYQELPQQQRVLFIGRLEERKGVFFALEAWREIVQREPSARLSIAGSGSVAEKAASFVKLHGLESSVVFLGRVPEDQVPAVIRQHDLVLTPSQYEGMGLTAAEAMAEGRPVIATRVCGLEDVVEDGKTGLLVEYGDTAQLASAALRLLKDPSLAAEMGRAGIVRAREHFSIDRIANCYVSLLKGLLPGQAT